MQADKKVDYNFVLDKKIDVEMKDAKLGGLAPSTMKEQETQQKRLDKVDRELGFGQQTSDFTTMPSLGFCFDQFACEMLLKPSQATSLVDLQAEFNQLNISS